MRVILLCRKVERVSRARYRCELEHVVGGAAVAVEMGGPLIPGETYTLLLCGVMPGATHARADDVRMLQGGMFRLEGVTPEQELESDRARKEGS